MIESVKINDIPVLIDKSIPNQITYKYNNEVFVKPVFQCSSDSSLCFDALLSCHDSSTEQQFVIHWTDMEDVNEHKLKDSSLMRCVHSLYDLNNGFSQEIHAPISLGIVSQQYQSTFSKEIAKPYNRVLDMPIKFPNSSTYHIPRELVDTLAPLVRTVAHFFHKFVSPNIHSDHYYCYLTIDQSEVKSGEYQRKPGVHVDGFQGARVQPKHPVGCSFIMCDCCPPLYHTRTFETSHLDVAKHNFFSSFQQQIEQDVTTSGNENSTDWNHSKWKPEPYELVLMDAYSVHESQPANTHLPRRTFFRMSYSTREFDRLGNAINPLIDYHWEYVPRNCQQSLL